MYFSIGILALLGLIFIGFLAVKNLEKELNQEWLEPEEKNEEKEK